MYNIYYYLKMQKYKYYSNYILKKYDYYNIKWIK